MSPAVDGQTPRIRRAQRSDWPSAQVLLRQGDDLHAAIAPDYFRAGTHTESEWRRLLEGDNGVVFMAEVGPAPDPAGLVAVRVYDTPRSPTMVPRRRGHVETLVVDARHRRHGIGRVLMQEAAAWARVNGAVELVLTTWAGNTEADAFYARLGCRVLSNVLSFSL